MVSITRKIMMYSNTMVSLNIESLDSDRLLEQYVFKRGKIHFRKVIKSLDLRYYLGLIS